MAERTVVEWDKDDLDALGILKVDVLALGMLSCLRKGFDLLRHHYGRQYDLASIPPADKATFDMLCRADSLGVFQVESRAQMAFLPRMKPRDFYDLVIEVAIVRPGPIQGDMVHPYLRRRAGLENVDYPSADCAGSGKNPWCAVVPGTGDENRHRRRRFHPGRGRPIAAGHGDLKKTGTIGHFRDKMISGMIGNGYDPDFAERCFQQIEGFGNYGFRNPTPPVSRFWSISSWLKCIARRSSPAPY